MDRIEKLQVSMGEMIVKEIKDNHDWHSEHDKYVAALNGEQSEAIRNMREDLRALDIVLERRIEDLTGKVQEASELRHISQNNIIDELNRRLILQEQEMGFIRERSAVASDISDFVRQEQAARRNYSVDDSSRAQK